MRERNNIKTTSRKLTQIYLKDTKIDVADDGTATYPRNQSENQLQFQEAILYVLRQMQKKVA